MNIMLVSVTERTREIGLKKGTRSKETQYSVSVPDGSSCFDQCRRSVRGNRWDWLVPYHCETGGSSRFHQSGCCHHCRFVLYGGWHSVRLDSLCKGCQLEPD